MYQKYKNAELVKPSGIDLKDRLVGVQRVTKVTKGGRAFGFGSFPALVSALLASAGFRRCVSLELKAQTSHGLMRGLQRY